MASLDSFNACQTLVVGDRSYQYFSLKAAEENGLRGVSRLPYSLKVVLENLLRNEDGRSVTKDVDRRLRQMARPRKARPSARSPSGRRAC